MRRIEIGCDIPLATRKRWDRGHKRLAAVLRSVLDATTASEGVKPEARADVMATMLMGTLTFRRLRKRKP